MRPHTSVCGERIYMDRAMPEHIARTLVGDLVLSLLPRGILAYTQSCVEPPGQLQYYGSVVLQPAPQRNALTVSSARLTLSGRFR